MQALHVSSEYNSVISAGLSVCRAAATITGCERCGTKNWIKTPRGLRRAGHTGSSKSWIANWSRCPPTKRNVCVHTHRHTHTPLTVSVYRFHPAPTKWNLSVTGARRPRFTPCWSMQDPHCGHTRTHTCTHTNVQPLQQKRGWWKDEDRRKDSVISSSLLPHWVLSHLVMCLIALCLLLWPYFAYSSPFLPHGQHLPPSLTLFLSQPAWILSVFKSFSSKPQESLHGPGLVILLCILILPPVHLLPVFSLFFQPYFNKPHRAGDMMGLLLLCMIWAETSNVLIKHTCKKKNHPFSITFLRPQAVCTTSNSSLKFIETAVHLTIAPQATSETSQSLRLDYRIAVCTFLKKTKQKKWAFKLKRRNYWIVQILSAEGFMIPQQEVARY